MNPDKTGSRWDMVIIGGGITGAGIFREAVRAGLKTLLVEQRDFAWGTSGRSSKLIHGGLRYLKEGKLLLTRDSVVHRERLIREAPGLVESLGFLMPVYRGKSPGRWTMTAGLTLYDIMSGKKQHRFLSPDEFIRKVPKINEEKLAGGFFFHDAQVDDARLVLRLIHEAAGKGGTALNYTQAEKIIRGEDGAVTGLVVADAESGLRRKIAASVVVNATGAWAERFHPSPVKGLSLRPLRGSHLIFPVNTLPVSDAAVSFIHPEDGRPLFAIPWEGAILVGTTDVDHKGEMYEEPGITKDEARYIMSAIHNAFPSVSVGFENCISTLAGVRPVLSEGNAEPSQESREHVVWKDKGLVTVTGGKLTTFRRLAWDTLKAASPFPGGKKVEGKKEPVFKTVSISFGQKADTVSEDVLRRLEGRYGQGAEKIVKEARTEDLQVIPGTHTLWAELPYAAAHENVRHLSDLLLRRVRIGILTPFGGREHMERIEKLCEPVLNWGEARWEEERKSYFETWEKAHSVPV